MSLFMKFLAVVVLIFGVIAAIASPLMIFSTLLDSVIGFGVLYIVGEMISLMKKIRDAEKDAEKSQKETNDILQTIIQAGEKKISPVTNETEKEEVTQEKVQENGFDFGSGKAIKIDDTTIKCPFCGKLQKEDRSFCFYCGARFERE